MTNETIDIQKFKILCIIFRKGIRKIAEQLYVHIIIRVPYGMNEWNKIE